MTLKPGGYLFVRLIHALTLRYSKPALSLADQIAQLQARGMVINDIARAERYLSHIGYYRLSAYWLPFEQPNTTSGNVKTHAFLPNTHFEDVLALYIFDRHLRLLVTEAIERVEASLRTAWAYGVAHHHGPHGYMDVTHFKDAWKHTHDLNKLARSVKESGEVFIEHYRKRYIEPFLPPVWVVVETMTLGSLSHWLENTSDNKIKQTIAKQLGLPNADVLEKTFHALTPLRNVCAHHGRLWNRKFIVILPHIKLLKGAQMQHDVPTKNGGSQQQPTREIYNFLIVLGHILKQVNPNTTWVQRVKNLILQRSQAQQSAMGCPVGWEKQAVWV